MKQKASTIRQSFVYPELTHEHKIYAGSILLSPILREDGDWRPYIPAFEHQRQNGVESSACYIEAQQHTIATIEEEKFGELDNNYSARFNALLSDGTEQGGNPVAGADSIRHDGLISEILMAFNGLRSWYEYHSWKGVSKNECIQAGKAYLKTKNLNFGVIIEREYNVDRKYIILREGLKRSPVPMSLYGVPAGDTYMEKPEGVRDTHMVEALHVDDENRITILDTYEPFIKVLPANYNMDFAIAWTVNKALPKKSIWGIIKAYFADIWK